jgi:glyoxalase family protein
VVTGLGARPGGEEVLSFLDPDGLALELITDPAAAEQPAWEGGPVAAAEAIRGIASVTLWEQDSEATAELLTRTLGFQLLAGEGDHLGFALGDGGPGTRLDVLRVAAAPYGRVAAGSVHHVAFRVADAAAQAAWRERLVVAGLEVTPVLDRRYFQSIYFREPGGVLFEIATDPPGFTRDEPPDRLGSDLKLPPWLESHRARIAAALPPLTPEGR